MIKVMLVDDQRLLRESIKRILGNSNDIEVIACASNGSEAIDLCKKNQPDIILMDILMPVCGGIEATKIIKSKYNNVKILMLTTSNENESVSNAIKNGADGYILKDISPDELSLAIKSLSVGLEIIHKDVFKKVTSISNSNNNPTPRTLFVDNEEVILTDRELSIIKHIIDGKTNKEIADLFFIAEGRLKNIITGIISKLKVKDRTQLAIYAIKNNLI